MSAELKEGTTVRHPSRGTGKVATVIYSPLTHKPIKAWVTFELCGYSRTAQKYVCFVDDLVVVPTPPAPPVRPTLRLADPAPVVA